MTSDPRLSNGQSPRRKPHAGKSRKTPAKKARKTTAAETATTAKRVGPGGRAPMHPLKKAIVSAEPAPAIRPKQAFDGVMESFERSFKAAGQGALAMNAKLIDMARQNVSAGFDFVAELAAARHPADIARLQMRYWDERMRAAFSQARELRTLSAELAARANEPVGAQRREKSSKAA